MATDFGILQAVEMAGVVLAVSAAGGKSNA